MTLAQRFPRSRLAYVGGVDGVDRHEVMASIADRQLADDAAWFAVSDGIFEHVSKIA